MPQKNTDTEFFSVTDFRAGIVEATDGIYPGNTWLSQTYSGGLLGSLQGGRGQSLPGPPGSADARGTWGCTATPDGGLIGLPGFVMVPHPLPGDLTNGSISTQVTVAGMKAVGPMYAANTSGGQVDPEAVYIAYEYNDTGTNTFRVSVCAHCPQAVEISTQRANYTTAWTLNIVTGSGAANAIPYYGVAMDTTRFLSGSTYYPVLTLDLGYSTSGSVPTSIFNGFTPALAGAFSSSAAFTSGGVGPTFTHQNRAVQLRSVAIGAYQYTVNENIYYTDPALSSTTFTTTPAIFVAEAPSNIGVWGSISTGELLCIKQWGGGFIMSGDFNNASITRLPGIRSSGMAVQKGVQTPSGLVYITEADGAWIWNGSNSSEKISEQVDNSRFRRATLDMQFGTQYHCDTWCQWVFFPNNMVWDFNTNGWWYFTNPYHQQFYDLWSRSAGHDWYFWGSVGTYDCRASGGSENSVPCLIQLDRHTTQPNWSWRSNLIPPSIDRQVTVTEYELSLATPIQQQASNSSLNVPPPPVYQINTYALGYNSKEDVTGAPLPVDHDFKTITATEPYIKIRGNMTGHGYGLQGQVEVACRSSSNMLSQNQSLCTTANAGDHWTASTNTTVSSVLVSSFTTTPPPTNTTSAIKLVATGNGSVIMQTNATSTTSTICILPWDYLGASIYVFTTATGQTAQLNFFWMDSVGSSGTRRTTAGPAVPLVANAWTRVAFSSGGFELIQPGSVANNSFGDLVLTVTGLLANGFVFASGAFLVSGSCMYGHYALHAGLVPLTTGVPAGEWYAGGFTPTGGYTDSGGMLQNSVDGWYNATSAFNNYTQSPIIKEFHLGYSTIQHVEQ